MNDFVLVGASFVLVKMIDVPEILQGHVRAGHDTALLGPETCTKPKMMRSWMPAVAVKMGFETNTRRTPNHLQDPKNARTTPKTALFPTNAAPVG